MIGWIHGVLREKHPPVLLVDTGGVGYEMEAPMTTFYDLPATGEPVTLHVHHLVREDAQQLYAFARRAERDVFRRLLRVSGVGAKLGLAILSGMDAREFARCVLEGDTVSLSRMPGIGKKTAQRLVMEMRDTLDAGISGRGRRARRDRSRAGAARGRSGRGGDTRPGRARSQASGGEPAGTLGRHRRPCLRGDRAARTPVDGAMSSCPRRGPLRSSGGATLGTVGWKR